MTDFEKEYLKDIQSNCFWAGVLNDLPKDEAWMIADEIVKAVEFALEQANGAKTKPSNRDIPITEKEKLYKILKTYECPTGRIHAGVYKTEDEWRKVFPNLLKGDCDIKQDWFKRDDKKYKNMKLCHCNNPTSTPFEKMGRYGLKDNKHTSFMVTICLTCNKPIFFPHENFILATDEGTEETLEKIAQIIIKWIKEPTIKDKSFYCPECKGTTLYVDYCDNPDCPNMPCCGKPRELCDCEETGGKKT